MFDLGEKIWLQSYIRPVRAGGKACWPWWNTPGKTSSPLSPRRTWHHSGSLPRGPTCHAIIRTSTCATFQPSTPSAWL